MNRHSISEISISYSCHLPEAERVQIRCSEEAASALRLYWDRELIELQEEFKVLFLNRANRVIGLYSVSRGGTSGTVVDAKLVFGVALKCNAHSLILAHNHPSGNLPPSQADLDLTKKLVEGAKLLDLVVLDHLILTKKAFYSFADEGKMG